MNPNQSTTKLQTVQQELTCPLCGNTGIKTSWKPDVYSYGTGESMAELTVDVPVRRCEACDFEYLDDEAEQLKHGAICRHLGVL
ncbi:MAG: YgiT-type zinc finger protein [Gammaproteobacteria bacterium]|nr:YgiT-type zinc finger protein [Gammaproteobacteria bacterium]MDE0286054.1 YgiT-type zinc finger protein [Gammaproteobacteria bacterium]MDE0512420.1 YgiT-type zinc finger protein [Gammaproteobacteria bacterium]